MDKEKLVLESIKLAVSNLQLNGVSPKEVIIYSIQYLMELCQLKCKGREILWKPEQSNCANAQAGHIMETQEKAALYNKMLLLIEAYMELGFPYESQAELFEQVFHAAGLTEDEVLLLKRRSAKKLRLNKSKVESVLGRWNPKDHSNSKKEVVEDIIRKVRNQEPGEYFYYSRWKDQEEDVYQLVVGQEGNYFCHVNRQKYYEFEDRK